MALERKLKLRIVTIENSGKDPYELNNNIVKVQRDIHNLKSYIAGLNNIAESQNKEIST